MSVSIRNACVRYALAGQRAIDWFQLNKAAADRRRLGTCGNLSHREARGDGRHLFIRAAYPLGNVKAGALGQTL